MQGCAFYTYKAYFCTLHGCSQSFKEPIIGDLLGIQIFAFLDEVWCCGACVIVIRVSDLIRIKSDI